MITPMSCLSLPSVSYIPFSFLKLHIFDYFHFVIVTLTRDVSEGVEEETGVKSTGT